MRITDRLRPAVGASLKHLGLSFAVALLCAGLVFGLWYPYPYSRLIGGRELFMLVISVDVISGPLLTLVVFNPRKPRAELWRDLGLVVMLQLAALGYGLSSVAQARPVFLAFEGDRFRVVRLPDVDLAELDRAPPALQEFSLRGPQLLGVRLAKPTDPDFPQSVERSMQGDHPAFRPSRWQHFEQQRDSVIAVAKPIAALRKAHPTQQALLDEAVRQAGMDESRLGWLPLFAGDHTDWVVVVSLSDGVPKAFLPLDGFQ